MVAGNKRDKPGRSSGVNGGGNRSPATGRPGGAPKQEILVQVVRAAYDGLGVDMGLGDSVSRSASAAATRFPISQDEITGKSCTMHWKL